MGKLDGRVVLITGAARGQGEQEARLFAAEGAKVVLADVLDEPGGAVAKDLGPEAAVYVHLDVGEEADWAAAVAVAKETFGSLDGLVNNAGILRRTRLVDTSPQEFVEVCRVNQLGTFLGMRAAAPELAAAGGGTIVNISSYAALAGMTSLTSYAASKGAVLAMTRVAALELAAQGVRVNAVCPGAVDTPMIDQERAALLCRTLVPLRRTGRAEEVARTALYLTAEDSSYVTGQHFVVDGGWLAGVPVFG
ncbi:SDR family NAD(P)-dependent oxidoreductase [Streptomyces klenkii]|uniref:SDR family NAD(P)-dependent oxidoreductase n=1 Tax=Streptomyces klenkii TaxID=1420899 RepID=UPI0036E122D8